MSEPSTSAEDPIALDTGEDPLTQSGRPGEIIVVNDKSYIFIDDEWHAPPDRVSIEQSSPHFHKYYRKLGIMFEGKVTFDVVEYCVSEGWIRKQMRDGRNRLIYERGKSRTIALRGKVEPYWR